MDSRLENADLLVARIAVRSASEEIAFLSKRLPMSERMLMLLRFSNGYTYTEISAIMGTTAQTVQRKINKLLNTKIKQLRKESYASTSIRPRREN